LFNLPTFLDIIPDKTASPAVVLIITENYRENGIYQKLRKTYEKLPKCTKISVIIIV